MPSQAELTGSSSSRRRSSGRGRGGRRGGSSRHRHSSSRPTSPSGSLGSNLSYTSNVSRTSLGFTRSGDVSLASRGESQASGRVSRASAGDNYVFSDYLLTSSNCRVIHHSKGRKFQVVCSNPLDACKKRGHNVTPDGERGLPGYYQFASHAVSGQPHGCVLETHETEEVHVARVEGERARNRQLQENLLQMGNVPDLFEGITEGMVAEKQPNPAGKIPGGNSADPFATMDVKPAAVDVSPSVVNPVQASTPAKGQTTSSLAAAVSATGAPAPLAALSALDPRVLPGSSQPPAATAPPPSVPVRGTATHVPFASHPGYVPHGQVNSAPPHIPPVPTSQPQLVDGNVRFGDGNPSAFSAPTSLEDVTAAVQRMASDPQALRAFIANGGLGFSTFGGTARQPEAAPSIPPVPAPTAHPTVGGPSSILRTSPLYEVQNPVAPPKDATAQAHDANLLRGMAAVPYGSNPAPAPSGNPSSFPSANSMQENGSSLGVISPNYLPAMDPSTGDKRRAYKLPLSNADGLTRGFAPSCLSTKEAQQRFCEGVLDVVAFPIVEGASNSHGDESSVAEAIRSLANQKASSSGGAIDTAYKNTNRNRLLRVKNSDDLMELFHDVSEQTEAHSESMEGFFATTINHYYPHEPYESCQIVAQESGAYRFGVRTHANYQMLLSHLVGINNIHGWGLCKKAIEYHGKKLAKIRAQHNTRIQVMVGIYIYLRDLVPQKFSPKDWLAVRLDFVQEQSAGLGGGGCAIYLCSHCGTSLHSEDTPCPWQNKKSSDAKKAAGKFMRGDNSTSSRNNNNNGRGNSGNGRRNNGGNGSGNGGNTSSGNGGGETAETD